MPQETKSHPSAEVRANLEGWAPPLADEAGLRDALDKAFDYRGDVTITLKAGGTVEGYIFDRRASGGSLAECCVRLIPKDGDSKVSVRYSEIVGLAFTGRDTAAGKSFETWVRKYFEKKAAGERASIESETLD
jgi:hypothetical protein